MSDFGTQRVPPQEDLFEEARPLYGSSDPLSDDPAKALDAEEVQQLVFNRNQALSSGLSRRDMVTPPGTDTERLICFCQFHAPTCWVLGDGLREGWIECNLGWSNGVML